MDYTQNKWKHVMESLLLSLNQVVRIGLRRKREEKTICKQIDGGYFSPPLPIISN